MAIFQQKEIYRGNDLHLLWKTYFNRDGMELKRQLYDGEKKLIGEFVTTYRY